MKVMLPKPRMVTHPRSMGHGARWSLWWDISEFWIGARLNHMADCVEICIIPTLVVRIWL